ncbi:MAG TPA: tetratricopeptide repeat protein [Pirellulales bacterium]|jgi:tetratricopeptide (TPR) repeat protein|nr:tetratricopeptide repeat protein [Pirellulales bacterium]
MMDGPPRKFWAGAIVLVVLAGAVLAQEKPGGLAGARQLFFEGKYAEAEEAFSALAANEPVSAALGVARCREAVGQRVKADEALRVASEKDGRSTPFVAERARMALARGDAAAAEQLAHAALAIDQDQTLALWVSGQVHAEQGKLDKAKAHAERLVKQYNDEKKLDPDELLYVGLAAAELARWNRQSEQFRFLVNDFYPDLLKAEPLFWPAHYEAGVLFAEKYNFAEATREFKAALALNPNAAEVHAALGRLALEEFELANAASRCERALEINPECLAAWHLKADIHLANFEPRQAAGVLADAQRLRPHDEQTLGRLAAAYAATDGTAHMDANSRFGKVAAEVIQRNPRCGEFFVAAGDALDRLRRWPTAAGLYEQAIQRMPQLSAARGQWGMVLMRLGDEQRAQQVLDDAFEADPFNVRVNNTLKVLEVLADYETVETEHFRIKFDGKKDKMLARYMGAWLEQVYPQLVEQMKYEPADKSLFEVFSSARNTDGHGWFSARLVGLPNIHPIGACGGKIVALQSPSEGQQRFNWARVLKHEFVHVVNLQQTDFNIPHWFTEALAVLNEGYPRPRAWDVVLAARFKNNKLFELDSINAGFIRPHSSDDWNLAYCQALLYAQYMIEQFGPDSIGKMLAAYADNLTTQEAVSRSLGQDVRDFEAGYKKYVARIVAELPAGADGGELSLADAQKRLAQQPDDAAALAAMARAQLGRKNYAESRRLAEKALDAEARQPVAGYVRARLHLLVGETREALAVLEKVLDRQRPEPNGLALLAGLKLAAQDYSAAADLYGLGLGRDPSDPKWLKSLATVYLKSGNEAELMKVLERLAGLDPDDLPIRKKLAQLALARGDATAAERWALEGLRIQVLDPELHALRGTAHAQLGNHLGAIEEYEAVFELEAEDAQIRLALAKEYFAAGKPAEAKAALEKLRQQNPQFPGASELMEKIEAEK